MNFKHYTKNLLFLLSIISTNTYTQNYFQQEVDYIIDVSLNDNLHTLKGFIEIDYTNNAPQTLDTLWFHLWPNAYKNNSTRLAQQKIEDGDTKFHYSTEEEKGYIDSLKFRVNGGLVDWEYHPQHIDICKLILKTPLKSGENINISTPFFVKIPDAKFSRLGHVEQSYMITQWYPKPAVYDKDGWHIMPYVDQGEFYSEFGNFDVKITLPSNYVVGATGNLQNESEILFLNELVDKTNNITDFGDDLSFPKSNSDTKTLHYKEENIHDFGWFADKRFNVLKGEVELPYSKDKVTLWCMFTNNEAELWKNSIEYMHDATYYYSLWNGNYPYKQCTAVDGTISAGGGMEYPGVTVIGESYTDKALEEVIMHEVGHNWFYGMLASNERDHPWMDEGINSHNEIRYMRTKYPEYNMLLDMLPPKIKKILDLTDYDNKQTFLELIMMGSRTGKDQSIELHSEEYTTMNYGMIVYMKTAIVLDYLMAYLGEDLYDLCMQKYFEKWKFKHPNPEDLKSVFEETTRRNLDWFFDDIIKTTKKIDYKIKNIKTNDDNLIIKVQNKGEINSPFLISAIKNNEILKSKWVDGFKDMKTVKFETLNQKYDYIQIDYNGDIPEINRNNNTIKTTGILKKIEPLRFQILGSIDHPKKTQVFFLPNLNWNFYDKSLVGVSFYNQFLPSDGLNYTISPLYAFGTKKINGNYQLNYLKYDTNKFIDKLKTGIFLEKHSYTMNGDDAKQYIRIEPFIEIDFKKDTPRSKKQNFLRTEIIHLNKADEKSCFWNTNYKFSNKNTFHPYSLNINTQFGKSLQKINLILKSNYSLNQKKKLNIRMFAGFVNTDEDRYHLNMSAWTGLDDYTFSNKYLGRSESTGFLSQQITENEGFIKHTTDITSDKFLTTINIDYNLYKRVKLYVESGTNGNQLVYGTGLQIPLGPLNIYIPIFTENGIIKFDNMSFIRYSLQLDFSNIMNLNF